MEDGDLHSLDGMISRAAPILFLLPLLLGCHSELSTEITVPQVAIQQAVDAYMPVKVSDQANQEVPVQVTLTQATVILEEGADKIGFEIAVDVDLRGMKAPGKEPPVEGLPKIGFGPPPGLEKSDGPELPGGKQINGTVIVQFGVRYEAAETAFYCENASTEKIDFGNLPAELESVVCRLTEEAMNRYFAKNSVYTLSDQNTATNLVKSALSDVTVRNGSVIVTVGL